MYCFKISKNKDNAIGMRSTEKAGLRNCLNNRKGIDYL